MMRCIFKLHVAENSIDHLSELFENRGPEHNPPKLDWPYKCLEGQYSHIPTLWWASDSEVVPQVGWYVDVPNEPAECTDWGLEVRVLRVKLCRDYCVEGAPISYVEIVCRVAYEEG